MKRISISHNCQEACKDYLYSYISALLAKEQNLYFVTLQPEHESCVTPELIRQHTRDVFSEVSYVAVYETTNKNKKRNIRYEMDINWHSHLIMTESDFKKMKGKLSGKDIVGKFVYYLEGLVNYLSKQSEETNLLPEKHFGLPKGDEQTDSDSRHVETKATEMITHEKQGLSREKNQADITFSEKVVLYIKDLITDTISLITWPFSKLKFSSEVRNNSG